MTQDDLFLSKKPSIEDVLANHNHVAGVDEAGRGCLAGPVTAAAVILDRKKPIDGIKDSKKLDAKQRELLRDEIMAKAIAWAVGWGSVEEIDQVNILQATFLAMRRAVKQIKEPPDYLLVDGNKAPDFGDIPATEVIGGDAFIDSISAASILAKTCRDRLMCRWHFLYPLYDFSRHKGYPTLLHKQAIRRHGSIILHRRSFHLN